VVVGVVNGPATSQLCQPHMLTDLQLVNIGEGDYRFSGVCLHLLGPFRRSSSHQLTASLSGTWTLPYLVFAELATFLLHVTDVERPQLPSMWPSSEMTKRLVQDLDAQAMEILTSAGQTLALHIYFVFDTTLGRYR